MTDSSGSSEALRERIRSLENELAGHEGLLKLAMEDMKKIYEDLLRTQTQLMQSDKLAAIGLLSAGIIHEIKNPLMAIQNAFAALEADLIDVEGRLTEKAPIRTETDSALREMKDILTQGKDCAERLSKIVKDIRVFSRTDKNETAPTDLNQVLDSVVNIAWNEIKKKADLVREYGKLPPVECNSQQMSQVFLNLLVNAAQAIEGRGAITLKTSANPQGVTVEIRDTGSGIPDEIREKIFQPFFTTKDAEKGTGLGLSISADLVQKNNGVIRVESVLGKGTSFYIHFPL